MTDRQRWWRIRYRYAVECLRYAWSLTIFPLRVLSYIVFGREP